MCGIIGYTGDKQASPILLEGLRREAYRGYDSSGMVVFGTSPKLVRAVGKLEELEKKVAGESMEGVYGIGHCLSPKTLVCLADGRVRPISSLADGDEVCALDGASLSQVSGRIRAWKHVSPKHIYELKTSSTSIEASGSHKVLVWVKEGLTEKAVQNIKQGDMMLFPKRWQRFGRARRLRFSRMSYPVYYKAAESARELVRARMNSLGFTTTELAYQAGVKNHEVWHMAHEDRNVRADVLEKVLPALSLSFPGEGFTPQHSIHGNFLTLPEQSSPELMQVIGYFLGDGYAGKKTLRFKDMRKDVLDAYQKLCHDVFNLSGRVATMSDTKAYLLEINSTPLAEWFGKNIRDKKQELLEQVGRLPKRELAAFLRGLFDAEGYVGKDAHQIGLGMTEERIVRTAQLLLLQFGVLSSVSDSNTNRLAHWKPSYKLSVSNQDSLKAFLSEIRFTSLEKQRAARALVSAGTPSVSLSFKAIPYKKEIIWKKCEDILSSAVLRSLFGHGNKNLKNFATEATVKKVIAQLKLRKNKASSRVIYELEPFLRGDVAFQEVVSNKKKESPYPFLYDLEVVPQQNFFANGLLTHNSRWATHGEVTEENAHPHADCTGNIFVAHNGIVENYRDLKSKLEEKGHTFSSDTDTEVLAHLIEEFFKGNLEEAVRKAMSLVKGTYGLLAAASKDPGKLVASRLSSPLVIAQNGSGGFVASDPAAIIAHTKKVVFLEDGEVATVTAEGFSVTDLENNPKEKEATELEWSVEEAQKGGRPHFMLKEIEEQPESLQNALRGRLLVSEGKAKLGGLEPFSEELRKIDRLVITAMGTASLAAMVGEYMIEEYAGIPVEVENAAEFRYRKPVLGKNTAFLAISQSGETADTLSALSEAKEKGVLTLGIINVIGSTLAREVRAGIYNHAGPEIGVASTKAFTSQVAVLALLTLFLGRQRNLSLSQGKRIAEALSSLPGLIQETLESAPVVDRIAEKYKDATNFFFIGRKYSYPVALEGALKLKEITYIHAEGYGAGEMKHGPIALIDSSFPTVAVCPSDSVYEKTLSNIQEIKARRGPVIAVASEGNSEIAEIADDVIYIPKTLEMLTPILAVLPLQLLAYYIGVKKGRDVDKPRNLAKSVTVE